MMPTLFERAVENPYFHTPDPIAPSRSSWTSTPLASMAGSPCWSSPVGAITMSPKIHWGRTVDSLRSW